jgi:hypothetical protein
MGRLAYRRETLPHSIPFPMNNVKLHESKLRPVFKLSPEQTDLRTLDKNVLVSYLQEQIALREQPIEAHVKKLLKK